MSPVFPESRLRRNRMYSWLRGALRENNVSAANFILPLFVCEDDCEREIPSMPSVRRYSVAETIAAVRLAKECGIAAVMLFPVVAKRSRNAEDAYADNGLLIRAIRAVKKNVSDIGIIVDVALDPYTIDGHDGITVDGYVDNDVTLDVLCRQALAQARAGAHIVAPSDMMDGRVGMIRRSLDDAGYQSVGIMSYSVKFCSNLYAPFRGALGTDAKIDKRTYQLDVTNGSEAMREIEQDINEGADTIVIKPSLLYMDVIKEANMKFNIPIVSYIVSGEYVMLSAMGELAMLEACLCLRRAGASAIIAYNAIELVKAHF